MNLALALTGRISIPTLALDAFKYDTDADVESKLGEPLIERGDAAAASTRRRFFVAWTDVSAVHELLVEPDDDDMFSLHMTSHPQHI